jgi:hypothetical protein
MKFLAFGSILVLSTIISESEPQFVSNEGTNFQLNNPFKSNSVQSNTQNFVTEKMTNQIGSGSNNINQFQGFDSGINMFGRNTGVNFGSDINGGFASNTGFTFPKDNQNIGIQGGFPITNPSDFNFPISNLTSTGSGADGRSFSSVNTNSNNHSGKIIELKSIFRNYEGLDNNLKNPTWGSAMTNFKRLCPPNYQDGISKTWKNHPNARLLSNSLGAITGPF